MAPQPDRVDAREGYLGAGYGLKSWLLTTDHKRIGLLYMASITFFILIGGAAATLVRMELMTPRGDAFNTPDDYNRAFTLHGVFMVFFFLIPSIPAVLGNFLIPLMIGARDLAFPRLNLLSWYIYLLGGLFSRYAWSRAAWIPAGPSTRPTRRCSPTPGSSPRPWASSSSASRRS